MALWECLADRGRTGHWIQPGVRRQNEQCPGV